jgi:membrane protease YdiL (CAAX protease family)
MTTILTSPNFWLNFSRLTVLLFTAFIALMTYRSHLLLKEFRPDFNLLLSGPETIARLILVGICLFLAWLSGLPAADLGLTVKNLWWSLSLGFGLGLLIQLIVSMVTFQAIKYFGPGIYSSWLIRNILPRSRREWLLVALAFVPPVAMEELLFRTLLLGLFQTVVPLPLLILATSIIFGLMHQPQGKLGMTGAGAINIVFCLLFLWTEELLVPLAAHYTVNLLQVVAASIYLPDWLKHYE